MATHNHSFTDNDDDDDKFLNASDYFGSSSGAFSLTSDVYEAEDMLADGRGGIAWNPEVTAVGQHGSLSKIPLASHDGFHDCKQYFYNGSDMYTEDGANSFNLEDVVLDGAEDVSISLLDEPDGHGNDLVATIDGDVGGSGTLEGSVMTSVMNRVSSIFPKTDNTDDLRNGLQRSAGPSSIQEQNHSALLEAIVRENEAVVRAAENLNVAAGNLKSVTRAARYAQCRLLVLELSSNNVFRTLIST